MAPFPLPVEVALAEPVDSLPTEPGFSLEAKVDGWRALLDTAGRLYSRRGTDLSRPFSDVVQAATVLPNAVLDGELVAVLPNGDLSFGLLQSRAGGKGPKPAEGFSVQFLAFDVLAVGDTDWRQPYTERRTELLRLLQDGPPGIRPIPATQDFETAMSWIGALGGGLEGIVAKPLTSRYSPGRRAGWIKFKRRHTHDAVVTGITGTTPATQAAVLAQPDHQGHLRPVGVSLPLGQALRTELAPLLHPASSAAAELPGTVGGLPGSPPVTYLPVHPDVVVEIEADQAHLEFGRYRHRPRVQRIRKDLTPDQVTAARSDGNGE